METQNAVKAKKSGKGSIFAFFSSRSSCSEVLVRQNSTAFSDGAEPPDSMKLDVVEFEHLKPEKMRLLFYSNPEVGHLHEPTFECQKKREILNTKINMIRKSLSEIEPSSREKKKLMAHLKRYKRRTIQEVDTYAFDSLNKLFHHKGDNVIISWHLKDVEPLDLSEIQLSRPASFVKGGQGFVYAVHEKSRRKEFALKMKLRETKSRTAWLIEQREHQVLRSVRHEFIVGFYHYYCTRDAIFLVMEFLDGGCLWSHVAHNGLMPEETSVYYVACILEAIDYLHQRFIVYRDMKAENIVLDWSRRPKLIDFGMSKFLRGHEPPDMKPMVSATQYYFAGYLAPEIYLNAEDADHRVDIWGIGYLITEIHLGFGVFRPMPWDKLPRKHLGPNWELSIPSDAIVSQVCSNLLHDILQQDPLSRPPVMTIKKHPFFKNIDWRSLKFQRGPNLREVKFSHLRSSKHRSGNGASDNQNANCCQMQGLQESLSDIKTYCNDHSLTDAHESESTVPPIRCDSAIDILPTRAPRLRTISSIDHIVVNERKSSYLPHITSPMFY